VVHVPLNHSKHCHFVDYKSNESIINLDHIDIKDVKPLFFSLQKQSYHAMLWLPKKAKRIISVIFQVFVCRAYTLIINS